MPERHPRLVSRPSHGFPLFAILALMPLLYIDTLSRRTTMDSTSTPSHASMSYSVSLPAGCAGRRDLHRLFMGLVPFLGPERPSLPEKPSLDDF